MYNQIRENTLNTSFGRLFFQNGEGIHQQFSLTSKTGQRINTLMHEMLVEYTDGGMYYEEFLRVQIMQLLLLLAREYALSPTSTTTASVYDDYKPLVGNAIKYIDGHYTEPLRLDDVCRMSMVSKTYFCYLFKLLTKQTFVEYIMEKRIQKALLLLEGYDCSIASIAYKVGFKDSTHFSRTFKKVVGISPRTYRTIKNTEN